MIVAEEMTTLSSYINVIKDVVDNALATLNGVEECSLDDALNRVFEILEKLQRSTKKVLLLGNGGSSSIVAHMENDLCKADHIRALSFSNMSLLTALANDNGYDVAFKHFIDFFAEKDDVLVAVSSSGCSENIIKAVTSARQKSVKVITFSGFSPNNVLRSMGDVNFYIPSYSYGEVELSHAIMCHFITDELMRRRTRSTYE